MIDLTTLTTPLALLDPATERALRAHGGPYEYADAGTMWLFRGIAAPDWAAGVVYRVTPQPPKLREWWITGDCLWDNYTDAYNACDRGEKPIRVVPAEDM
jgi:hypothetical protein